MSDGRVVIDTVLNDKGVDKGLDSLNRKIEGVAKKQRVITEENRKMVGNVVTGLAVAGGAFLTFGIKQAANLAALQSQFDQVFGDLNKTATTNLNAIAEETGMLPNRLKGSFTQIAAFAKTTGASTADALDMSSRATLAAADSAAFYDKSIEEVSETMQSFLKGKIVAPRYSNVA